jgi:hypothetical protein
MQRKEWHTKIWQQIKSFFSSNSSGSSVTSSVSTVNIQPLFETQPCNTENDIDSSDPFNSSNEQYDLGCFPIEENSTRESSKRPRNEPGIFLLIDLVKYNLNKGGHDATKLRLSRCWRSGKKASNRILNQEWLY